MANKHSKAMESIAQTICFVLFALVVLSAQPVAAQSTDEKRFRQDQENKYYIGLGTAIVKFDTKIKFYNKKERIPVFVDPEGNLGLPEISNVNTIYGGLRISEKHSLRFSYFSVNRENEFTTEDLNLDDLVIIRADVSLSDKTNFLNLDYGYNLFRDYRSSVDFLAGIYVLDLGYVFEANGLIEVDGVVENGTYREEAKEIAPVPNIGLSMDFAFTPRWSVGARFSLIEGSFGEISASAVRTAVRAKYMFTKNIAGDLGISYFDADVTIEDNDTETDIGYGYNGLYAGLHWEF